MSTQGTTMTHQSQQQSAAPTPPKQQQQHRRITALTQDVISRIAAGEVINKPGNAIKELLENSLDAGATSINITVLDGGLKLLQITDNGHGIAKDDMAIVCHRHTTSKLNSYEDLRSIGTFGFRGEALASMSQVSHLTIQSKTEEQQVAYQSEYELGELKAEPKACAGTKGTIITARDLFFNLPQRKKSMNGSKEFKFIAEVVQRYALHNAGVSISLKRQGETKPDIHTPINKSVEDNIRTLFGARLSKELMHVQHENEKLKYKVNAYFSNTNYHEKAMVCILFINKRLVECKTIKSAIKQLFEPYLPKKAFPWVYVNLEMDPRCVDVNVHPTKNEVGFLKETEIVADLQTQIRDKLLGSNDSRVFIAHSVTNLTSKVGQSSAVTQSVPTSSLVGRKKDLPQFMDRSDKNDQNGQIENYLTTGNKKRPLPAEEYVPIKKRRADDEEDPSKLESVQQILESIKSDSHQELTALFKHCTYVGWINAQLSLIQYQTKLYVVDVPTLSVSLMHQLLFKSFGNFRKIQFSEPLDIHQMALSHIQMEKRDEESEIDSSSDEDQAKLITDILMQYRLMLSDYYQIEITDQGKLVTLPQVIPNHVPPLARLPEFLFHLASLLSDVSDEKQCLHDIAVQVAIFFSLSNDWELDKTSTVTDFASASNEKKALDMTSGYTEDSLKWVTQHVIFPACKLYFYPPKDFADDGTVFEIASLSELYKVFERC